MWYLTVLLLPVFHSCFKSRWSQDIYIRNHREPAMSLLWTACIVGRRDTSRVFESFDEIQEEMMRFEGYRASSRFDLSNSQCGLTKDAYWNGLFFETLECTFHSLCCIFALLKLQEPATHFQTGVLMDCGPRRHTSEYCSVMLQKGKKGMAACDSKPEVVTQLQVCQIWRLDAISVISKCTYSGS